jgi:hypothetical protein
VYLELQKRLGASSRVLKAKYDLELENDSAGDSAGAEVWRVGDADCL